MIETIIATNKFDSETYNIEFDGEIISTETWENLPDIYHIKKINLNVIAKWFKENFEDDEYTTSYNGGSILTISLFNKEIVVAFKLRWIE